MSRNRFRYFTAGTLAMLMCLSVAALRAAEHEPAGKPAAQGGIAGSCPSTGSCFEPHGGTGCDTASCCSAVCAIDSWCCQIEWDETCVEHAMEVCGVCGGAGAPDCFTVHDFPACDDPYCCNTVCSADPFCCDTEWDSQCVNAALAKCTCGGAQTGNCFQNHTTPYCKNAECCNAVCEADPFCCNDHWDNLCASEAGQICASCGGAGAGSCLTPHNNKACNNAVCCEAVCSIDPFCCNIEWDSQCANNAIALCASCGGTATGSCFIAHEIPFCNNSACCNTVCTVDPFCCQSSWDSICVNEANSLCCPADIAPQPSPNGVVDVDDLLAIINSWGPCGAGFCTGDIAPPAGNSQVDVDDLLLVINQWGQCP